MSGGQCLSKLCGTLARFEFDDEALSGSNRERKIPLRNAKSPTRLGDCHPKLLCVLDPHLTDRDDSKLVFHAQRLVSMVLKATS